MTGEILFRNETGGEGTCPYDPAKLFSFINLLAPGDYEAQSQVMSWFFTGAKGSTNIVAGSQTLILSLDQSSPKHPYDNS